jgi:predicted GNAT family acetyltransferase
MTMLFSDNPQKSRFEYAVERAIVFANYRREGSTLYIDYVEAPPQLRGTGAAGNLMQNIMNLAQERGLKVIAVCDYAVLWMDRHKEGKNGQ